MTTLEQCRQALVEARDNRDTDLYNFYRSEMVLTLADYCSSFVKPLIQQNNADLSHYREIGGYGIAKTYLGELYDKLDNSEQADLVNIIETDLRLRDHKYNGLV